MTSALRASRGVAENFAILSSTPFVCRSCRHQALRKRITILQQSRCASNEPLPYTEKLRRKIWGTDNPPGLKDPYGGPSFLEKRRMARDAAEQESRRDVLLQRGEPSHGEESETAHEDARALEMVDFEEPGEYVPAETWDGLEHVGNKGHWADEPPRVGDTYEAFGQNSEMSLQNKDDILRCLETASATGLPSGTINLRDKDTFRIIKQFVELSGYRIPDPIINKSKTWEMLVDALARDVAPKPKKIAELLMSKQDLINLPNLKIMARRETPVDKEKEVGRWKVIEAELQERGLPVLGKLQS